MSYKKLGKIILIIGVIIVGVLTFAVYQVEKRTSYDKYHPDTSGKTVSIILIDGLSQEIFQEAIAKGDLPNLSQLISESTFINNGIGAFPSVTGYAYYPFITGVDASESGILGLRWFDRSRDIGNLRNYVGRSNVYMNQEIHDSIKTIFELSGDSYTASVNSILNRGVDDSQMTSWIHVTAKFEGKSIFGPIRSIPIAGKKLTKDHFEHETEVIRIAKEQLIENPKAQWISLPSPDAYHHVSGLTDTYHQLLNHIDQLIGELRNTIDSLGQSDTRMIAIVTDHGISNVYNNIDVQKSMMASHGLDLVRGNSVNYQKMVLDEPMADFIEKDGYWVINGNLSYYLYLRDPNKTGEDSWRSNLKYEDLIDYKKGENHINIPEAFANQEGIELVIYRKNDSTIVVQNQEGLAEITERGQFFKYNATSANPLEYDLDILQDTFLTKDEWIELTHEDKFPDAIYRLTSLMKAPNISDLVLTSLKGYDLAKDYEVIVGDYKGGHGGLRGEQLRVPYIIYQPQASGKLLKYARAEDVGQMIIGWLGFDNN